MSEIQTVREHLKELKKRLIKILVVAIAVFFVSFLLSESLILFLINHLSLELFVLAPMEFIKTQLVVSAYITLAFTLPFILVQLYKFSKPLMKKEDKKRVVSFFVYSLTLAIIGCLFGLLFFSKFSLGFFASLPGEVSALWGVYSSIIFVALSGLAFAITAQIIILIPVLVRTGIVEVETLKRSRKIVIVLTLTISAILSSPDPVTQILMGAPMYVCFETGLLISMLQRKNTTKTNTQIINYQDHPGTNNIENLFELTKKINNKDELMRLYVKINSLYEQKSLSEKQRIYPELLSLYEQIRQKEN